MRDQSYDFASFYFTSPQNRIIGDITPINQAIYVPSVSPSYVTLAYQQKWNRVLPKGIKSGDFDFLDPNNGLFRISHVMSSAGQALNQRHDCIITKRDRNSAIMIGDSGGYQIAQNKILVRDDNDRRKILNWLETHANIAMTLDVPTGPLLNGSYNYKSFDDCLRASLHNLKLFDKHRYNKDVIFLNVLQGNDQAQSDAWYDEVKAFEFEGWAFGGILRHNFYLLCRRILIMYREGKIQNKKWIHVLGTNELETAVLLTALQRSINRHIDRYLRISFDTSSPFRNLGWGNVYGLPRFDKKSMAIPPHKLLSSSKFFDSDIRWPWPSPLGNHLTMGDIAVRSAMNNKCYLDTQSNVYLAHHNLSALCFAIASANRAFDAAYFARSYNIASHLGAAAEVIDDIMRKKSMEMLIGNEHIFNKLRHTKVPYDTGDQERDLCMF